MSKQAQKNRHSPTFDDDIDLSTTTNEKFSDDIFDVDKSMKKFVKPKIAEPIMEDEDEEEEYEYEEEEAEEESIKEESIEPTSQIIEFGEQSFKKLVKQHDKAYEKFKATKDASNFKTTLSIIDGSMSVNFTWDVPKRFSTEEIAL